MDLGFNLAQSNRDLKDLTSRQIFGDTSGLLCKNDLIPCHIQIQMPKHINNETSIQKPAVSSNCLVVDFAQIDQKSMHLISLL